LIPIRFIFRNKLRNDDKLLLGFDAYVLSQALGCEIETGKIIHGDNGAVLKVRPRTLVDKVQNRITQIAGLLSGTTPPDLILNRHCSKCGFRDRCRKKAQDTDELSLLSAMTEKERSRTAAKASSP
jgi:predicted RecB family nuclease